MNRERVNGTCEFRRERLIDHAVTVDAALAGKRIRHNIDAEMCFTFGTRARVSSVQM